jgi:crotonobetainyl-CoA:carnitine CoA-transferase CaiB-like acyl-CoA transferase
MDLLDGIRVVTIAQNLPGPLAVARLKQAGASVVKIEPPAGDPFLALSPAWHAEMHEGIAIERLDLKSESGHSRILALLEDVHLFVASQRPSTLKRLGLEIDALRKRCASLRMLRILGSVRDPELAGHDLTYQAEAGLVGDATPRTLAADVMGSERAFAAALMLLRQRPGSIMDVGLVDSLDPLIASLRHGLTVPTGTLGGGAPRYRVYPTKVGRIAVAALESHFESRLYSSLGLPLSSDPSTKFLERTAVEWESWARELDLPIVAVKEVS